MTRKNAPIAALLVAVVLVAAPLRAEETPNLEELERRIEAVKREEAAKAAKMEADRRATAQRAEAERKRAAEAAAKATLVLRSDAPCRLSIDGAEVAELAAATPHSVTVAPGQQLLQCVSTDEAVVKHEEVLNAQAGSKTVHDIAMAEAVAKAHTERLAAEKKAAQEAGKQAAAAAAERKRQAVRDACATNPAADPICLVDAGGGVLRQPATGLEWTQADNGSDINWRNAKRYCEGKGGGWRLPDKDELYAIYDQSGALTTPCNGQTCEVSPLFRLSGLGYWSGTAEGSSEAWYVFLDDGHRYPYTVSYAGNLRALCVRRS